MSWEIAVPGAGNGSPTVYGDRIFLMSADPNSAERYLLCYELGTGRQVWRKDIESVPHHLHKRSSYASCTPCVNSDAVYFTWATPKRVMLAAYSHDGEQLWMRDDLGPFVSQHGYGASPALFGDILILFNSQQAQQLPPGADPGVSQVMAFNAASGESIWNTTRTATRACYGLPSHYVNELGEDSLLFANTGDGLFALRLSDGKPLWNRKVFAKRCVSSPQIVGDLAIGTEGSGGGGNILYGVDLKGNHEVKLTVRSAPYVPTPIASGQQLFLWGDNGIVTCVKLPGGQVAWKKRIGGNVSSSPVIAGDKLVGISEDGTLTVLAASDQFANLGSISLGDTCRATPYLAEDYMLLRTNSKMICVGNPPVK